MAHFGRLVFRRPRLSLPMSFTKRRMMSTKLKTMQDIRKSLQSILEIEKAASQGGSREHLQKYLPKKQSDLPMRTMKDSFDSALIPLGTDADLRELYTTFLGEVRLGRLMEDIDMFAVWCCTKHLIDQNATETVPFPYVIVTIRIDDIELMDYVPSETVRLASQGALVDGIYGKGLLKKRADGAFTPIADIRVSGHVCWVGKSSLEVVVWLDQDVKGEWMPITRALLLMAARNATNTGPGIVNPIKAETPEERELLEGGEKRKQRRLDMMRDSLLKKVPTEEELSLIHNLFIKTMDSESLFLDKKVLPPNGRWMHDATLKNLVFCHPEHRNLHNKIFGGFLIRQALELAWSTCYLYMMKVPRLVHISDIGFYSPVDVGSLLKLYASITYTEDEFIHVFVYAEAFSSLNQEGKTTNSFNFTYKMSKPSDDLYPRTYLEAMKYIDGRRHLLAIKSFRERNKANS